MGHDSLSNGNGKGPRTVSDGDTKTESLSKYCFLPRAWYPKLKWAWQYTLAHKYFPLISLLFIGLGIGIIHSSLYFNEKYRTLENKFQVDKYHTLQSIVDINAELKILQAELDQTNSHIIILDGTVNNETRRKQRIVNIRQIIKDTIASNGLKEASLLSHYQLTEIAAGIIDYSDKYDLPVPLFMGLLRAESAFNPNAVSKKNAKGLGQIIDSTAEDISKQLGRPYFNPFKISHNLEYSAYYLAKVLHRFGNKDIHAMWAYNAGPEFVAGYLAGNFEKLPLETQEYAERVSNFSALFREKGAL